MKIQQCICDYFGAYILVTGDITATPNNEATQVIFKNCAPFEKCRTEINGTLVDEADFINITMLCAIELNIVTIILILQEVYGILKEMK